MDERRQIIRATTEDTARLCWEIEARDTVTDDPDVARHLAFARFWVVTRRAKGLGKRVLHGEPPPAEAP